MSKGSKERRSKLSREYILYRKNECEKCGVKNTFMVGDYRVKRKILTVHHIDHNPANNDPKNLMTLCRKCHVEIHKNE